jgi:hypothetical protein
MHQLRGALPASCNAHKRLYCNLTLVKRTQTEGHSRQTIPGPDLRVKTGIRRMGGYDRACSSTLLSRFIMVLAQKLEMACVRGGWLWIVRTASAAGECRCGQNWRGLGRLALEELSGIPCDEDFFVAWNDVYVYARVWRRDPPLGALKGCIAGRI